MRTARKWSFVLLALLFVFFSIQSSWSLNPIIPRSITFDPDRIGDHPPPRWPACDGTAVQNLSFIHVSDTHANYNPDGNGSSPFARLRGYYEQTRRENPFTLFTNAGDDYEKGSIAEVLSGGRVTRKVVQAMGYDVRTLGNHDFAWGLNELLAFSRDPTAIVLAANIEMVDSRRGTQPGWTDFAVLTVGCVRIGFFGLVSKPWNEKSEQYDGSFLPELQSDFHYAKIARRIISRHRRDVDLLVLVSHLGIHDDVRLAEQTDGIDLILGGHTHTVLEQPRKVKGTSIVHVGANVEHIGRMDIAYDTRDRRIRAQRFELVPNREDRAVPHSGVTALITEVLAPYREELNAELARVQSPQTKESMARIAAQAAVKALGMDAAIIGTRTVWTRWPSGLLTQQDVLNAFRVEREPADKPGLSSLYRIEVTGEELIHARDALADFVYWGPRRIDPKGDYTLGLQKPQALHQKQYFGRDLGASPPKPAAELWEAVVSYGRTRTLAGLSLDETPSGPEQSDALALLRLNKLSTAPSSALEPGR